MEEENVLRSQPTEFGVACIIIELPSPICLEAAPHEANIFWKEGENQMVVICGVSTDDEGSLQPGRMRELPFGPATARRRTLIMPASQWASSSSLCALRFVITSSSRCCSVCLIRKKARPTTCPLTHCT